MPTTRQLVALVALVAICAGAVLGMYALTPVAGRGLLLDRLAAWAPGVVASIGVLLTWLGVKRVQGEHGAKLDAITYQTNGILDEKIRGGVRDVLSAEALKVWQEDRRGAPAKHAAAGPAVDDAYPTDPPAVRV